ncbi:similar to fungal specific transcription factor [Botrytis cinerea T4]|nr:similar to fungal specific transcription factor [Botrytis cinerea T4]
MITKALWNIPSLSSCNELLERYQYLLELSVIPEFMIKYLISSIYNTFGSVLAEPRSREKFIPFVETLLKNEETPLPSSPDDGIAWLDTFSGPNIRFESMGLFFCFIGRAYQSLLDGNPLFQKEENHGRNRRQTGWRMNECADVMGKMCECTDTVNEIVVAFRVSIYALEGSVMGDESYSNLNRHGSMVTSACAIGLHRLPHLPPHLLTTAAEYKRRVFASVYIMDKYCSALIGTPPGISRLYCRLQMPSDLSETELFLPRTQMQQAIAACDEQGWNVKREIYCGTCYRANLEIYMIKEEILEGALGVDVQVSRERIDSLLSRTSSSYLNQPPWIQFNPSATGRVLFVQLSISLEALQNTFLLYRLAVANRLEGNYIQGLLDTALEMLEKMIMMWEKRDVMVGFEFCFDWFITIYGIPAAGVICVELLKRMGGSSTSASGSEARKMGTQERAKAKFPKSTAIQKLTLFGAFLDWVRDTDGNYALLRRVRGVVGRVLKWVLDGGDVNREVEREKEKSNSSQEDPSRMAQSTFDSTQVPTQGSVNDDVGIGNGITAEGPQGWENTSVNFMPHLGHTGQAVLDDNFTASLDFNAGLESLDGIGMEEMWGQVDWLNAGDWTGGVGMGGTGNGNEGFGFGF